MNNPVVKWVLARLSEPSTWSGIAALIGTMTFIPNYQVISHQVGAAGVSICGLLAVVLSEGGSNAS